MMTTKWIGRYKNGFGHDKNWIGNNKNWIDVYGKINVNGQKQVWSKQKLNQWWKKIESIVTKTELMMTKYETIVINKNVKSPSSFLLLLFILSVSLLYPHCTPLYHNCTPTLPQCSPTLPQCTLTVTPLYPQYIPTVPSLYPHCTFTVPLLYPNCIITVSHCTLIVTPL